MKRIFLAVCLIFALSSAALAVEPNFFNLTFDPATKTGGTRVEGSTPLFVKYEYGIAHYDAGSLAAGASANITLPVHTAGSLIPFPAQVEIVSATVVATANSVCRVAFYSRGARRGAAYNQDNLLGSANFNSLVADGGFFAEDAQGIVPYINEDGNSRIEATISNNGASTASYYLTVVYRY